MDVGAKLFVVSGPTYKAKSPVLHEKVRASVLRAIAKATP